MGSAKIILSKGTFTRADIAGNIEAFMAIIINRNIDVTSILLDGYTRYVFTLTNIPTYAVYNQLKQDIDTACASVGITIEEISWIAQ